MKNVLPSPTPEQLAERFAEIHPPFAPQEAVVESNRCLFCYDAPCTAACPTHIDVPRFIKKIATGNLRGSATTILDSNILGLSCSRVCPVDVLCEGACVMHRYNKAPIEIGRLQRHAMDYFYDHVSEPQGSGWLAAGPERAGRVACIGGGPASLGCAAELRRKGYAVTVFESRPRAGGLNTYGVAEYKFRPVDSEKEIGLVRALGVEFRMDTNVGSAVTLEALESDYDVIFIGVGLGPTQALGIEGENLPGVVDAVTFIAEYKTGTPRVGRRVVVIGGGNTAIDAACAAKRLGAEEVTMVYRRSEAEMPAFKFEFEHAKQDGVKFMWRTVVTRIRGRDAVEGVDVEQNVGQASRHVPSGALDCDMVILSIGQSKLFRTLAETKGIEMLNGRVKVDAATGQTTNARYFAGGDCVNGGREVVDAVAEGTRAGRAIAARFNG
jgi:dihydropyrimidine dehydrogenase (NAD+) subunit PreT